MKYDIFLSYAQNDKDWVRQLADALSKQGLRVFLNQNQVNRSRPVAGQLEKALRESAYIVPIVSTPQLSPNQAFELGAALGLNRLAVSVVADEVRRKAVPAPIRRRTHLSKGDPRRVAELLAKEIANGKNNHSKQKAHRLNRTN